MKQRISILIINKNELGVKGTLMALQKYSRDKSVEVLVVDASNHRLDTIYSKFPFVKKFDFKAKRSVKKSSIPEQRNYAVDRSSGDILVFLDASCIPQPGWLNCLMAPILKDDEAIVAGSTTSLGKPTRHDNSSVMNKSIKYLEEAPTINLALKRKVFFSLNGFDESFDYGSDVDFSWRAIEAGYKIRNQPTAIVSHDWGTSRDELKRSLKYGRARMYLFIKHKNKRKNIFTKNVGMIIYPLFVVLLPITILIPWYPALILVPFARNIKRQPFMAILDHVIYGFGGFYELAKWIWNL